MSNGGWGNDGMPSWVWSDGSWTEAKNLLIRRRVVQAFWRVRGAQWCAASIIRMRSIMRRVWSEGIRASSSRLRWARVVHTSQIKGKSVAQGGYCNPLVPLPKCRVWNGGPTLIHCAWYDTWQGWKVCFLIVKPEVANKHLWRADPVSIGSSHPEQVRDLFFDP